MNNYIPYEKLSKKEKKKLNAERRKDWNEINPKAVLQLKLSKNI